MLRLDKITAEHAASGQIVNLMSNDVNRLEQVFIFFHFIWVMPLQVGIIAYVMWNAIGPVEFVGIGVLLLLSLPFVSLVTWAAGKLRKEIAKNTDARVQFMSELVSGIQVIKMYAWEKPFGNVIKNLRLTELSKIKQALHVQSVLISSFCFVERTALFATLVLYVLSGGKLTADVAFVLATLFGTLQSSTTITFPLGLMTLSEARISIQRIQEFLMLREKSPSIEPLENQLKIETADSIGLVFDHVFANWIKNQTPPTLQDISFTLESGKLCGLVGSVGSGKTAILNVILQELEIDSGDKYHQPNIRISYASQEPWLFNGTIRDNIIFGQVFDSRRYDEVTEVCALREDFKELARGDATIVGERGSMLSGGQKARVNLARAVYKVADLYLLDDPLSAVDSRVAQHLFEKCIVGFLKGKTTILATHQLGFISRVDTVIYLNHGTLRYSGDYDNIKKVDPDLMKILEAGDNETATPQKSPILRPSFTNENIVETSPDELENSEAVIDWNLIKSYFCFGVSRLYLASLLIVVILTQLFISGNDYWLGFWTNIEDQRQQKEDSDDLMSTQTAIYFYSILITLCIVFSIVRNLMLSTSAVESSKQLHDSMYANLLDAKMSFFAENPSGRILNRFSKDIGAIDEILPRCMINSFQIFSKSVGIFTLIIIVYRRMALPIVIIVVIFYYFNKIFVRSIQALRNLEAAAKSPVFSHVKASLDGLVTIRSSGEDIEKTLINEFDELQDTHSEAYYLIVSAANAMGLFVNFVIQIFIAIITFTAILMYSDKLSGGNIGLALSQSAILTGKLQYGMRLFGEFLAHMISVSRVLEYTNLPKEDSPIIEKPIPKNWPSRGQIQFRNVSMRYKSDSPTILQNLNLKIEAGWKVGIVGRTGAGKSSIILALFRLYSDFLEGEIIIEDLDTSILGLRDLRSKISIIPQDPVLFTQTIRYNLDPFFQFEDSVLVDALRWVKLENLSLDQLVTERGCNFSVGQRQLICLARAIIKNNKILVLDEATASIDNQTDTIIQNSVRSKFATCTVLTIAHRLNTVIDSDCIVVMDKGRIVEFGRPYELLSENPNGHFSKMVEQTRTANRLMDLAREKYFQTVKYSDSNLENNFKEVTQL